MSYNIKLTSKGQITLPKEIREQFAMKMGDYLHAQVKDNSIVLKPIPAENGMMVLMECAEQYGKQSIGLEKVRELTGSLKINTTEYVRNTREEEGNEYS